jgi:sarcosine oxidase subunit beta
MAGVNIPVLPYRRHIFITDPVNRNRKPVAETSDSGKVDGPSSQPIESRLLVIDFETSFYFHREGAGILFGMSDPHEPPGYDMTVSWDFLEEITPIITRRLPLLLDLGIARAWAGLYEVTPDAMPIIGPVESVEGFFQINGFSGHGFQHSPAAGRILADLIADGSAPDADLAQFSLARFNRDEGDGEMNVV